MNLEGQVIQCAASAYMVPADQIRPETVVREEFSAKSMQMLAFVSSIENELDVMIPLGSTGGLVTIQDFIDKVTELAG